MSGRGLALVLLDSGRRFGLASVLRNMCAAGELEKRLAPPGSTCRFGLSDQVPGARKAGPWMRRDSCLLAGADTADAGAGASAGAGGVGEARPRGDGGQQAVSSRERKRTEGTEDKTSKAPGPIAASNICLFPQAPTAAAAAAVSNPPTDD